VSKGDKLSASAFVGLESHTVRPLGLLRRWKSCVREVGGTAWWSRTAGNHTVFFVIDIDREGGILEDALVVSGYEGCIRV
jgi:hypothetical protein